MLLKVFNYLLTIGALVNGQPILAVIIININNNILILLTRLLCKTLLAFNALLFWVANTDEW